MFFFFLATSVSSAASGEYQSPDEWQFPPVLVAWGPGTDERCGLQTWERSRGWRELPAIPHACPLQEAFLHGQDLTVRWTGKRLIAHELGRRIDLPTPSPLSSSFQLGFEVHPGEWYLTMRGGSHVWGMRGPIVHRREGVELPDWHRRPRAQAPDPSEWERRDLLSDAQDLTRGPRLSLARDASGWMLDGAPVQGLAADGSWLAFAPPRPPDDVGGISRRIPLLPSNRAVVVAACFAGPGCHGSAPVFLVLGRQALPVDGPTGPVYVSQTEGNLAVVDERGVWLVEATTGLATLRPGVTRVVWTRRNRLGRPTRDDPW